MCLSTAAVAAGQGLPASHCPVSPWLAGRGIIPPSSVPLAPHPLPSWSSPPVPGCPLLLHHGEEGPRGHRAPSTSAQSEEGVKCFARSPDRCKVPGLRAKAAGELGDGYLCLWLQGWLDRSCLGTGMSPAPLLQASSQGPRGNGWRHTQAAGTHGTERDLAGC